MAKTVIHCPDIECDSCVQVIGRSLGKLQGVKSHVVTGDKIEVEHDERIKPEELRKAIESRGYRASFDAFERVPWSVRLRELFRLKKKYAVERTMLRNIALAFLLFLVLEATFVVFMNYIRPGFLGTHGIWLFYLVVTVVSLAGALWHFKAYRARVTCMTGMMIGMTIGMQTGMMLGAIIGATNGFFVGALTAMIVASAVGAYAGSCCGTMGTMQGLMAGIMGGTMGPMISFMMFTDHIVWFMPPYMAINLLIMAGFSIMLFEELAEGKQVERRPAGIGPFLGWSALALVLLNAIIVLAPASVFLG